MVDSTGALALKEVPKRMLAPAEDGGTCPSPQTYDLVLQAVGRTPNGKKIAADKAGVAVTDRGFINVDIQMRTNVPHIFAIGDIVMTAPKRTATAKSWTAAWSVPMPVT
ncbi:dihydrolipoyl dehydrogenase [mine drainage metagenome]|uniref:Dihydrolipoyl dehydrogenase n=1 Tax=mine drainage metagenome TaxID=410659 RepID=A0A1J5QBI9_9ZZZZ